MALRNPAWILTKCKHIVPGLAEFLPRLRKDAVQDLGHCHGEQGHDKHGVDGTNESLRLLWHFGLQATDAGFEEDRRDACGGQREKESRSMKSSEQITIWKPILILTNFLPSLEDWKWGNKCPSVLLRLLWRWLLKPYSFHKFNKGKSTSIDFFFF